ncbi:PREDICTED: cell division cycle 20.2, cofactor of APC complex-like isoform X2 [Vollenhovia emeryi]|nr:PREDICTED: cell division cycle 20.2, cofactor of APC complex-like isoform X2 [Vollenhovia emeryi]
MSRFLLDTQNLDWQIQGNETPLRAAYPRFRRTELFDGAKSIVPRNRPLSSALQEAIRGDPEQRDAQKFRHPDCIKVNVCPLLISKHFYSGDRFLPCRRGYNFEMAHYLLTKDDTMNEKYTNIIDVCAQVDSLEVTYRRKALRAIMVEQALMPEFDQDKILRFSGTTAPRPRKPSRPESEKKGSWKCAPRKRILMGSPDKMLSMPECASLPSDANIRAVDWSCNNMIAMSDCDRLDIYDNNGENLSSYTANIRPSVNQIVNVKWSDDGNKLIMSVFTSIINVSTLVLYDLKKKKPLWCVDCICKHCEQDSIFNKGCVIRCVCWSAHDHQIVTGCAGKISIYDPSTGKLVHCAYKHTADILTMSFSPNFKYLISTGQDKVVRVSTWPELTPCFDVKFSLKPVTVFAWHPQVPDLLCMGSKNGSLSLWNANKCTMVAFVRTKFDGCVENLAWNKLSGELVVHWTYREGNNRYTIVTALASFNRIVDVLPLDKETELLFLKFNSTHEQLITFCSSNVCSVWNFFGNEKSLQRRRVPRCSSTRQKQGVMVHNPIR